MFKKVIHLEEIDNKESTNFILPMAEKANITPNILIWARESARITEEVVASKVSVPVEKLKDWETSTDQPTIRQAQTLAKAYKRPFAIFFLPDIPRDFQPLQDFRRSGSRQLTTSSVFIIREIQQKQSWISELYSDNNEPRLAFVGRFTLKDKPADVANDILSTLDIQPSLYKTGNPIREWIDAAESNGIFVSGTSFIHSRLKLDSEELQGFAISDPYAPFVFINSDDWNAPQLFTLVHELAHIWIAESGISNEIAPGIDDIDKLHPVELFCNEVAANALMPEEIISDINKRVFQNPGELFVTARTFGISSFAFLVRSLKLKLISYKQYAILKKQADIEFAEFLKREEVKKAKKS